MTQHEFSTILKESKSRIDSINDPNDLLGLPYPQGCIQWYNNGMIIAAGGAGPTKCGLANGFEILQFIKKEKENKFQLKRHSWYNTGQDIVYCIRQHPIYPYQFIAGIGNNLVIMEISSYSQPQQNNAFQYDWMKISKIKYPSNAITIRRKSPINTIYVLPNIEYKKLPNEEDPFCVLKVAISSCGKLIATGGTDGIVRLFKYDFIDPNNTSNTFKSKYKEIDITHQHFKFLNKKKKSNQAPPEIERLLFYKNKYLSICNREFACYIWNINKNKMETILMMDKTNYTNYIFRDCAFIEDNEANKYCICAVNGVRESRKSKAAPSYLYQYFITKNENNAWYKRHYIKIIRSDVKRMIANMKTRNIITLHLNGMICVLDGLNLIKLYSFKNEGRFFMDIAISPNLYSNYKMKDYQEYLLLSLLNDLVIKPIILKPCYIQKGNGVGSCCCNVKCITGFLSVIIVIIAIMIGCLQQDSYQYASAFQHNN